MLDEEWIKTLSDGRGVKFIYQELPEDGAFIRTDPPVVPLSPSSPCEVLPSQCNKIFGRAGD
jgi:hypothetical protein